MIGGTATAQNVLLQDAPSGSWQIQTKLDVSTLTNEGEQAGFILWQGENPNTFAKITYISKGTFAQYEWVATRNGAAQISAGPQISTPDGDVWLRVSTNGSGTYIAEGSTNGEDWQQIAGDITEPRRPGDAEVRPQGLRQREHRELRRVRLVPRGLLGPRAADARRPTLDGDEPTASSAGTRRAPQVDADRRRRRAGRGRQDLLPRSTAGRRLAHLRGPVHGRRRRVSTSSSTSPPTWRRTSRRPSGSRSASTARRRVPEATMTGNQDTGPLRGHAQRARRRQGLGHRADRVPRRRRAVDDLLGHGRPGDLRRLRGLARPVEAGAERRAST